MPLISDLFQRIGDSATKEIASVEEAPNGILIMSAILMIPVSVYMLKQWMPETFDMPDNNMTGVHGWYCALPILIRLWSGLDIDFVTEECTSHNYTHVRETTETQRQSAATGIICRLALDYFSRA